MRRLFAVLTVLLGTLTMGLVTAPATTGVAGATGLTTVGYDTTISPNPVSLPSEGYEATSTSEMGQQIQLVPGTSDQIDNVVVDMESWACETGGDATCVTTPGATFSQPITLNLYNVGPGNAVGSVIDSVTQTFNIPYRPSSGTCPTDATAYLGADSVCHHGILAPVTFSFATPVTVPDNLIYGVAFNTEDYGASPIGAPGPYDSLNLALNNLGAGPSVGTDPAGSDSLYQNSSYAGFYCGGPAGTFRIDDGLHDGCWTPYEPAVQFNMVVPTVAPAITSASSASFYQGTVGQTFTVTATGTPAPTLSESGTLPSGVTFDPATGVLSGTTHVTGSFPVTITASNVAGSVSQSFTLTVLAAAPAFTSAASATFVVGQAGAADVTVTGSPTPTVTELGALPAGVSLVSVSPGHYQLAGTPAAGTGRVYSKVKFIATSTSGLVKQLFTLTVDQAPAITSVAGKAGKVGSAFSMTVKASGFPAPTFSSPSLPAGVTLTNTGNGKATLAGHFLVGGHTFTMTATNGTSPNASQTFTLTGK